MEATTGMSFEQENTYETVEIHGPEMKMSLKGIAGVPLNHQFSWNLLESSINHPVIFNQNYPKIYPDI